SQWGAEDTEYGQGRRDASSDSPGHRLPGRQVGRPELAEFAHRKQLPTSQVETQTPPVDTDRDSTEQHREQHRWRQHSGTGNATPVHLDEHHPGWELFDVL